MYFIDNIDFELALIRFEPCLLDQFADIIYSSIARRVDLDTVEHRSIIERLTVFTCMTWIPVLEIRAVDAFREYARARSFPRSPRSMKEVGMTDTI